MAEGSRFEMGSSGSVPDEDATVGVTIERDVQGRVRRRLGVTSGADGETITRAVEFAVDGFVKLENELTKRGVIE